MTTLTLIALVALAAPVIWGLTLYAWVMWTLEPTPPDVDINSKEVRDLTRDLVAAIWISGFGGGLLVAEALRGLLG